jgi:hypothetical protein
VSRAARRKWEIFHEDDSHCLWRVVRCRTHHARDRRAGDDCAGNHDHDANHHAVDNTFNHAAHDNDHAVGDDAELKSLHAGSRNDAEWRADARHRQPDDADGSGHTGCAQSRDAAAILDVSADGEWHGQSQLCARDPAVHVDAALVAKGNPEKEKDMKFRSLALCGASLAFLSLGATAVMADPASGDPYTQNPTPQERAQTQNLNAQSSDQAVQSVSDAQSDNDANQAQYDAQQQQYQDDKARYEAQKDRYLDQRAEYDYDRSHPYAWWHDRYSAATLNHFYDIPRAELIDLRVMREDGFTVGRIRAIDRHGDGRVAAVRVVFRNGESAWVKARDLRYDPDDRIVFTDLSVVELHALARNS